MLRFKEYLAEATLSTTDIGKGERLGLFAANVWAGKAQEAESGTDITITKITISKGKKKDPDHEENEYNVSKSSDKQKFIKGFNDWRDQTNFKVVLFDSKGVVAWSKLTKTAEYGGITGSSTKGPTGAQWESLITYHVNLIKETPKHDMNSRKLALSPKFKGSAYEQAAINIANNFLNDKTLKITSLMTQHGAKKGKGTLSSFWKNEDEPKRTAAGATNSTPKTDMYTDNFYISLKKKGGSQVASGTKEETIATFYAALQYMGENPKTKAVVNDILQSIEGGFNEVALNYGTKKLKSIAKGDLKWSPSDSQKKQLTTFTDTDLFHKNLNKKIKNELNIEEHQDFINWFVFEAMSGFKKFGTDGRQSVASICTTFDADNHDITSIKLTSNGQNGSLSSVNKIPPLSSELLTKAKGVKIYAAWKSSGIRPYSTLRVAGDNHEPDYVPLLDCTLDSIIRDELSNDELANQVHRTLNEDLVMLDEFALIKKVWGKIKSIGKNAMNWIKGFFAIVMKKVKVVFEKIKKMGKKIFEATFEFLGITITKVKTTVPKDLHGFFYGMAD